MKVKVTLAPVAQNGSGPWAFYWFSLPLSIFLHVAVMLVVTGWFARLDLFLLWLALTEGGRFAFFAIGVINRRSPIAMLALREWAVSPRVFFTATLLFFAFASAPAWVLVLVSAIWVLQEFRAFAIASSIDASKVIQQWKKDKLLERDDDGWIYQLDDGMAPLLDKARGSGQIMGLDLKYIALPLAVIAPALFFISQRAGSDFELRAFIAGVLTLFVAYFTMPTLVSGRISRRAIRALRRGDHPLNP